MTTTHWTIAIVTLATFIAGQWTLFTWVFKRLYGDYQETQDRLQTAHASAIQQTADALKAIGDMTAGLRDVCTTLAQYNERTSQSHASLARSMQLIAKYQGETLKIVERINGHTGERR
jgi:methionine synthase II (cobalamin-independent)